MQGMVVSIDTMSTAARYPLEERATKTEVESIRLKRPFVFRPVEMPIKSKAEILKNHLLTPCWVVQLK
jgi:hypothetical protein